MKTRAMLLDTKHIKHIMKRLISPFVLYRMRGDKIYLTFDDGPTAEVTPKVLDVLTQYNVPATFFFEGRKIEKYPEIVRSTMQRNHSMGYHSYGHNHLNHISWSELSKEFQRMKTLIKTNEESKPYLFRPPYGKLTLKALLFFVLNKVKIVQWSIDSGDSDNLDASKIINNLRPEKIKPGDIVLFHDDAAVTPLILPTIIKNLADAGFRFGKI